MQPTTPYSSVALEVESKLSDLILGSRLSTYIHELLVLGMRTVLVLAW